ncbi:alpha/beta-hydrolase [Trichodelitschia bisporula]|uniref:Carboxylic ester hydrolase n=1 Tax=Trichodelitschia bisporula TaxID=703511 RepID=A0A6G1HQ53_9PEZI|nr:alpha/beta-hydrolase [Trichodelitschia bisporula]
MKHSLSVVLLLLRGAAAAEWVVGQPVQTTSGVVRGHPAEDHNEVSEYLGIPFAAPPLGPLRFAPPAAYVPKGNATIDARAFGPDCPALVSPVPANASDIVKANLGHLAQNGHNFSEDCLTLNIWTKPQDWPEEPRKAVLVWIYGGGFTTGSTAIPFYNGQVFAERAGTVVVSINYRVNVFGFPGAPLEDMNLGLLDQRKAVEWVRDNIAAFGGDPNRITLFGESAGARAVDIYSYAWTKDPIVNGFIAESGAAPLVSGTKHNPATWFELSTRLGCGGSAAANKTVECVRGKTWRQVLDGMGTAGGTRRLLSFVPVVDEKVYFSDYDVRAKEGRFIKRPMLVGNNDNEGGLSAATQKASPAAVDAINAGYTCGAAAAAARRRALGIPAWRYRFVPVWSNQAFAEGVGAYHSSEIPAVFGLSESIFPDIPASEEQLRLSATMNKAWTMFAQDPEKGLLDLRWPLYDAKSKFHVMRGRVGLMVIADDTLIILGEQNTRNVGFDLGERYDAKCASLMSSMSSGKGA